MEAIQFTRFGPPDVLDLIDVRPRKRQTATPSLFATAAGGLSTVTTRSECRAHRSPLGSLALIAIVIGAGAAAFAYTAGWFSPERLTPTRLVAALAPPTGPALGHRRNHAKGICFTGVFEANGAGSELSKAQVFARGRYPVLGRFNLGTADPNAPDATVRVRGLGIAASRRRTARNGAAP